MHTSCSWNACIHLNKLPNRLSGANRLPIVGCGACQITTYTYTDHANFSYMSRCQSKYAPTRLKSPKVIIKRALKATLAAIE
ncbi:hypothetical protein PHLCEN_2v8773 [Hermanssonia centrifuga]|uniref:Uncharacterized protein n=1 Tax=Hermanssonia centrifuga TaxID=98765 RepID=A0A2R6NSL9_9APHY|nr:hypothetical protein PHLCEN_2v8773 [Hermanssonia centrifuga]